ncbi:baseplate J/gp47 family protein [Fictibacillus gelatini]|uniref:baseplate J/gp47 family protein n=1 Tax=Fictibacillus gelatini TaxID=225985 RepID=UPI000408DA78|nr:baseplate J/gp47 family protein [Fictibacillus gelatini]
MVDENGFQRKTYADLIEEMEARAKELFGEKLNLTPRSFMGILIRLFAWFLAVVWQVAEKVYNNSFPGTAEGVSLDRLAKLKGMTRLNADYAYGKINITGNPGAVIPSGFVVGTQSGIHFETTEEITLDGSGKGVAEIYAVETGSRGNMTAGQITEIITPLADVSSITNLEPTAGGRERETDAEFYARFQEYPSKKGASGTESIKARLLEVPGVRDAIVNQNTAMVEKNGIPPKSIAPFVFGGEDQAVAQAIFSVKAGGIQSYGTTVIDVRDSKGNLHQIGFSRPTEISVFVKVQLTKGANFPSDGIQRVKNQILSYIGGKDENGFEYPGLGLDQDVVYAKLVAVALSIDGVDDAIVQLSTDGINYSQSNIVVSSDQVAKTSTSKVVIT